MPGGPLGLGILPRLKGQGGEQDDLLPGERARLQSRVVAADAFGGTDAVLRAFLEEVAMARRAGRNAAAAQYRDVLGDLWDLYNDVARGRVERSGERERALRERSRDLGVEP